MRSAHFSWRGALAGTALFAGCATPPLSPMQLRELETHVYDAPLKEVFAASREVLATHGVWIAESDFEGGLLTVSQTVPTHNPQTALTLSLVLPPAGDVYMDRYGWALLDLLALPYSILWAAPWNYQLARKQTRETRGPVFFEALGPERTRVRIHLMGGSKHSEDYSVQVRRLQEAIDRELFLKEGEELEAGSPPEDLPAAPTPTERTP